MAVLVHPGHLEGAQVTPTGLLLGILETFHLSGVFKVTRTSPATQSKSNLLSLKMRTNLVFGLRKINDLKNSFLFSMKFRRIFTFSHLSLVSTITINVTEPITLLLPLLIPFTFPITIRTACCELAVAHLHQQVRMRLIYFLF